MTPDVVVVGGGPAGLATAIVLGRHGVRTWLIERRRFPVGKPCGEGLLPNAVRALGALGIDEPTLIAAGRPLTGIRYFAASGRTAEAAFRQPGVGICRTRLSALLVARLRAFPSVEVSDGSTAQVGISEAGAPWVEAGGRRVTPRLVVAADGLGSRGASVVGLPSSVGRHRRWGIRRHFAGEPWTDHVEVSFAVGCEAYVTPVADGVNVAFLWEPSRAKLPSGVPVFEACVARFPRLAERLAGRAALERPSAAGPFRQRPLRRYRDGVVLVGDAGGYLDPITGEGVGLALAEVETFARVVVPVLTRTPTASISSGVLRHFARAATHAGRSNGQLTRLMLWLSRRPRLVERAIGLLGADPALFEHCLAANMGARPAWRVPPASVLRLFGAMV